MFERLAISGDPVQFTFDGQAVSAQSGDSVAAALLAAGRRVFRATPVSGAPRGPFCMMGACHDCLVEIDGETVQACQVAVSNGLKVRSARIPGNTE